MKAQALVCSESQEFTLDEIILPDPGPTFLGIRTLYSGVSIGTEFALIKNKVTWGPFPICTGYQGVGIVDFVGEKVEGYNKGDKVYFRNNNRPAGTLETTDGKTVTCAAGTHSSYALVDPVASKTHGVEIVPEGIRDDVASMFVMPAVGYNGVNMSGPVMGDKVVVHGSGLIGLGVVAACSLRGCEVTAIDLDDTRLEIAKKLGADHVINGATQDIKEEVAKICPDGGADVVFESTGVPACIDPAIELVRPFGKFIWQGNYGEAPISMKFLSPHGRRLTMFFPCDDGMEPCRKAVMKLMASGAIPWEHTLTHTVEAADSALFFDRINKGEGKDVLGATIHWSD